MRLKELFKILLIIIFPFFLGGCSSESEENPQEITEISRELLIGTWTRDEADIIFEDDGTGESQVYVFDGSGEELQFRPLTWRLDSINLTVHFSVTGTSIFQIIELNENSMILQDSDGVRRDFSKNND